MLLLTLQRLLHHKDTKITSNNILFSQRLRTRKITDQNRKKQLVLRRVENWYCKIGSLLTPSGYCYRLKKNKTGTINGFGEGGIETQTQGLQHLLPSAVLRSPARRVLAGLPRPAASALRVLSASAKDEAREENTLLCLPWGSTLQPISFFWKAIHPITLNTSYNNLKREVGGFKEKISFTNFENHQRAMFVSLIYEI